MLYILTDKEKKFLRDVIKSPDGIKLKNLLNNILKTVDSVSSIDSKADYGAQVEGRKITRELLNTMLAEMDPSKHRRSEQPDVDDYD